MFAHSDIARAASVTSTGTAVATTNGRILGLHIAGGASDGTLVLRDGGGSGTNLCGTITVNAGQDTYWPIPGAGIPFGTDVHATLTNVAGVTVVYANDNTW